MFIINGKIYTMAGDVIEKGYVRTGQGKILAVDDMDGYEQVRTEEALLGNGKSLKNEEVLDVKGAWVLPGLIEAHAHIGITEEKEGATGDDCNETSDPVTPTLRAIDAVNPMDPAFHDAIRAGITSVMAGPGSANVVGGQFVFMKTQGRCVDNMIVLAPAAMKAALGENPKNAYGADGKSPVTRMATAALLREQLFKAWQYRQKRDEGTLGELDFQMEAWMPVLAREIPLKVHAHRADDILTAIRIGKEFCIDLTLDHCTDGHLIAEEIKESGYPAIVGTDLTARNKPEVKNMNFKTNAILHEAGILIAVTTDHPVALIQYLPLCAGLAVKQGLPMEEGLKAITINPAKICRTDERVGSLEVGKDADIAVFSGNPMEVFTETLYTIIDGEIVYRKEEEEGEPADNN
ncbi:MAG: amidohydrolase family protein [Lachnospiraceae bacterium]|nr:amidohydrolase family protein [Lachnospiraceae bacterium]